MIYAALMSLIGKLGAAGLKTSFGFAAAYSAIETSGPALCSITLTIKRDGTWTVTVGANDAFTGGIPTSGTWHDNPSATVGDGFEVQFADANRVNTPNITNGASSYTALTSDRTILISKNGAAASADLIANVRATGTSTPVLNGQFNAQVDGV